MSKAIQAFVVVVILAGGGWFGAELAKMKQAPDKQERIVVGPLVEVVAVKRTDVPLTITGHGSVAATVKASIVPQVGGRVIATHPNLITGGFVPADAPLLKIDDRDYTLALERAKAELEQAITTMTSAESQINEARTRLTDARADLERTTTLRDRGVATDREVNKAKVVVDVLAAQLSTGESTLATARAQRDLGQVAVRQAELNVARTTVTLPFDAVIVKETVDVGQFVVAGQSVGEAYGTKAVEIAVPLEDRELRWFPMVPVAQTTTDHPKDQLPKATVRADFMGKRCQWTGKVVRTDGMVDSRSRMVHMIVEVQDPFDNVADGNTPLMPGVFAQVDIEGKTITGVIPLPRYALRDGDTVWVVDDETRLRIRKVEIARRDRDNVYISEGLTDGDRVVVSGLDAMTDGMTVRVTETATDPKSDTADVTK
ncbi:MAG: efflux RND transporter periplasmic adaptor subunit [Phycisphaera sp.]|nr:efflux RND transporter periplasmic adaptor subunit [Phycisphaera sp.]